MEKSLHGQTLVTPKVAARILGTTPATLATWRCTRAVDIPWVRVGKRSVRYRIADISKYIEENRVSAD